MDIQKTATLVGLLVAVLTAAGWVATLAVRAYRWWRQPSVATRKLRAISDRFVRRDLVTMPVLGSLPRTEEVERAIRLLAKHHALLVTGEGGTGKSAIALLVSERLRDTGEVVLHLRCDLLPPHSASPGAIAAHLDLREPLADLIAAAGRRRQVTVILDQLDTIAETPLLITMCSFARQVRQMPNTRVMVVSRTHHVRHVKLISELQFQECAVEPLGDDEVRRQLAALHVHTPSLQLVAIASNLLNLSLVATLASSDVDLSGVEHEIDLWDRYREELRHREGEDSHKRAICLAVDHLRSGEREFPLERPLDTPSHNLVSRGVLERAWGERYRFRHEDIQDYLYAWDAAIVRALMPEEVVAELPPQSRRGVLRWMQRIYHRESPEREARFVRELLKCDRLPFYDRAIALDVLREQMDPHPQVIPNLLACLKQVGYSRYFFRELDNPAWLRLLVEAGVFARVPTQQRDPDPLMDMVGFLNRVGPSAERSVVAAAEQLVSRDDYVLLEMTQAILTLSATSAVAAVPSVLRWLAECRADLWIDEVRKLLLMVLQAGHAQEALQLLAALTELAPLLEASDQERGYSEIRGPAPRHDEHGVLQVLADAVPAVAATDPTSVVGLLECRLCEALARDCAGPRWADPRQYSFHWRQNVGPAAGERASRCLRDALFDALRDVLLHLAERGEDRATLDRYLRHEYSVFRRLSLHILALNTSAYADLVEWALAQAGAFPDSDSGGELFMLWQAACGTISAGVRSGVLDWLVALAEDEDSERRVLGWLWVARDHGLPPDHTALLARLVARYGEPAPYHPLPYGEAVWLTSPIPAEQLATMPVPEIAEILLRPFSEIERLATTAETPAIASPYSSLSLAHAVQADVAQRPSEYTRHASLFLADAMPSRYVLFLLIGWAQAWEQGAEFDWAPVLALCEGLLARAAGDLKREKCLVPRPETRIAEVHCRIAGLLQAGYEHDQQSLPDVHDARARQMLLDLLEHEDPLPGSDGAWEGDAAAESLNVVRGKALHALVRFALHRARTAPGPASEQEAGMGTSRIEPDVREAFADRLRNDPSPAVRAVFGMCFPQLCYLDHDWAFASRSLIFDQGNRVLWRAAWRSFVSFNGAYHDLYDLLRSHYRLAIADLATPGEQLAGLERADEALAAHLAMVYWFGWDSLESDDSLVRLLFQEAGADLRSHATLVLRSALEEARPGPTDSRWIRMRALWVSRLAALGPTAPDDTRAEAVAYTSWLEFAPEGLDNLEGLIRGTIPFLTGDTRWLHSSEIPEYLQRQAQAFPALATELLISLLSTTKHGPGLWHKHIRPILETAMASNDDKAKLLAVDTINLLGEMGDYRYRDLLPEALSPA
ncbi:MAG: hypothetical protein ACYC5O_21235 [Anaerolineae bacterium]